MTQPVEISGTVTRLRYKAPKNSYFIAEVNIGEKRNIIVVGNSSSIDEGFKIKALGTWEESKFGLQLKAKSVELTEGDASEAGVLSFLSSKLVEGVGPSTAKAIVDVFGAKTLEILLEKPSELKKVKGIGPARLKTIKESIASCGPELRSMIFLSGLGVSEKGIAKILERFELRTEKVIRENPYLLCDPFHGVKGYGFRKADAVAKGLGIVDNSAFRIEAAILSVMSDTIKSGSTGIEPEDLKMKSFDLLLSVPYEDIEVTIGQCLTKGSLVESRGLYFNKQALNTEAFICEKLKALNSRSVSTPSLSKVQLKCEAKAKKMGITLDPAQTKAVVEACTSNLYVITGRPGAGKTTITKLVVDILIEEGLTVAICAPTGKAAKRASESIGLPATTIHRLLESSPTGGFKRNSENPLYTDVIIADESSMFDIYLMRSLLAALKKGARLILVGDPDQIPSVGPGNILYDIVSSGVVKLCKLTRVFRQGKGSPILDAAYAIGDGFPPKKSDEGEFISKIFPESEDGSHRVTMQSYLKDAFKELTSIGYHPVKDIQILTPMVKGTLGTDMLNSVFSEIANPNPRKVKKLSNLTYKTGDKVIQTKNNYEKEVFNGEIGYISDMTDWGISIEFDGRIVEYTPSEYGQFQLAYALTIHKCQGSEFPAVIMPLDTSHFMMLQRNLVYTGVTRAKKKLILASSSKALFMAVKESGTDSRITELKYLLQGSSGTQKSQSNFDFEDMLEFA